jgi:hypothetical protein
LPASFGVPLHGHGDVGLHRTTDDPARRPGDITPV